MMRFGEKETICERVFEANGPFWHLYTDGSVMEDIFADEEQMREGMIQLAVCATLCGKAEIITFELMHNHAHLILRGAMEDCMNLFEMFKRRLRRWAIRAGRCVDWNSFNAQIIRIETLKDLRYEIIYVNRNAYVANRKYTPFSYPWGGGWAYFSPVIDLLPVVSVTELGARKVRDLTHYRCVEEIASLKFVGDVPFIPSFCRVDIGQSVFQDARSYFHSLTRNSEAFSQIASRLKDSVFLTDDEMFMIAARYAETTYAQKLLMLTPDQKLDLARKLHFEYNATNQQLRRILKLDIPILNELFPPVCPQK